MGLDEFGIEVARASILTVMHLRWSHDCKPESSIPTSRPVGDNANMSMWLASYHEATADIDALAGDEFCTIRAQKSPDISNVFRCGQSAQRVACDGAFKC